MPSRTNWVKTRWYQAGHAALHIGIPRKINKTATTNISSKKRLIKKRKSVTNRGINNLNKNASLGRRKLKKKMIHKKDENRINFQKSFYVKPLIKKSDIYKNCALNKKLHGTNFCLFTKKRHKEALALRKYRMTGPSTARRHHGLDGRKRINKVTMLPHKEIKLPVRRCIILGKMDNWNARKISKSGIKTHRKQRVNLLRKRIYFEEEDRFVKLRVSARGLKTIKKYGLGYCCKKFNLDLSKKKYDAGRSPRRKKKKTVEFASAQNDALNQREPQVHEDANEILKNLNLDKKNK